MNMSERARLGGEVTAARYRERAETLRQLLEQGEGFKRAAWRSGMSVRAARRWRRRFSANDNQRDC